MYCWCESNKLVDNIIDRIVDSQEDFAQNQQCVAFHAAET